MNDFKLKPCPFCGRRFARLAEANAPDGFRVICGTCNARTDLMLHASMAVDMWNMRLDPAAVDAAERRELMADADVKDYLREKGEIE